MANLDTRSKRASCVQILRSFVLAPVLPAGRIEEPDRWHIAWVYSGWPGPTIDEEISVALVEDTLSVALAEEGLSIALVEDTLEIDL